MKYRFDFFVLAGAWLWAPFIYFASIWQRRLFLFEYIGTDFLGFSPFFVRLPWIVAVLFFSLFVILIGKLLGCEKEIKLGISFWLLSPLVFFTFTMPGIDCSWWQAFLFTVPWIFLLPIVIRYCIKNFFNTKIRCYICASVVTCIVFIIIGMTWKSFMYIFAFLIYSIFLAFSLFQLNNKDYSYIRQIINLLSGVALGLAVLVFVVQVGGRLGIATFVKHSIYSFREPFWVPVLAGLVAAVWWRMSADCEILEKKYWCFLVGLCFILLSSHASIPLKIIRNNAPSIFLRTAVQKNIDLEGATLVADAKMLPVVKEIFCKNAVLLDYNTLPLIKQMIKSRKQALYIVVSNVDWRNAIPGASKIWRAGNFMVLSWPAV